MNRFCKMEDIHNAENETGSPIQEFYKNKSVFITGGTGFLGKVLVEKLLRSCPQVNSLYLLIRQKKSKDCQQRIQEYLEDEAFSRLDQKARLKIIGIPGDISQPGLALSDEHTKILKENVEVVFHSAATIRFDEALPVAVAINVCGTKEMLELASQMKNLKAYVHVSTAYSNCNLKEIDEKIYSPPTKPENLISLAKNIDNNFMDQITPILLDKWPNTYVYTKNVAEDIVKTYSKKLPISIFRPAIVVGANEEPVPGWIDNLNGVTGVMAGTGTGVLRTLNCDENVIADVVPVDMTVNALIATAWKRANRMIEDTNRNNLETEDVPVYNYVSSVEKQIKWGELMELSVNHGSEVPPVCAMWCYCLTLNKSWLLNKLYVIFLHFLPAIIMDRVASLFGKRTNMLSIYKKINKFADVLGFFTIRDWKFSNSNVQNLWKGLSEQDKKLFPFDISSLDWSRFFYYYVRGVRQYILKEDISTVPQGKVRFRRFLILHKGLKLVVGFFFLRLMWLMISPLFS